MSDKLSIFGQQVLEWFVAGQDDVWSVRDLIADLGVESEPAKEAVNSLVAMGYLSKERKPGGGLLYSSTKEGKFRLDNPILEEAAPPQKMKKKQAEGLIEDCLRNLLESQAEEKALQDQIKRLQQESRACQSKVIDLMMKYNIRFVIMLGLVFSYQLEFGEYVLSQRTDEDKVLFIDDPEPKNPK